MTMRRHPIVADRGLAWPTRGTGLPAERPDACAPAGHPGR
jgi:hypothetical protein